MFWIHAHIFNKILFQLSRATLTEFILYCMLYVIVHSLLYKGLLRRNELVDFEFIGPLGNNCH